MNKVLSLLVVGSLIVLLLLFGFNQTISGGSYLKDIVWSGHSITASASHPYGDSLLRQMSSSTDKFISHITVDELSGLLVMESYVTYETAGSVYATKESNAFCIVFNDINIKDYSQIEFKGSINLDTGCKDNDCLQSCFTFGYTGGIDNTIYQVCAPNMPRADGNPYQHSYIDIGNLVIKITPDFYYVYDGSGKQLELKSRNANDNGNIFMCGNGGIVRTNSGISKFTASFGSLILTTGSNFESLNQVNNPVTETITFNSIFGGGGGGDTNYVTTSNNSNNVFSNIINWFLSIINQVLRFMGLA